jgi:succinate dehydrogenase/fumarate reductase cytochrome b subunit
MPTGAAALVPAPCSLPAPAGSAAHAASSATGIRHLVWDTGRGLSLPQVRKGGWAVLVVSFLLAMFVWWSAS